jgi:outer membrane protein, heavy metal efflux system
MKLNIRIYTMVFVLLSPASYSQTLTLDSVLKVIKVNSHMIHEYDWKIEAMKEYSKGAKSWSAPMIGAGTFMTAYPYSTIMDERDKGFISIVGQQEIPNPAKLKAKKEYLDSKASIEEAGREMTFNELRAQAKEIYYQWIVLEKKRSVLKESEAIISMMRKLAEIRYPYSTGSLGNIYKAEGRLYEVQNMVLMTEAEIEQKNILLNTIMNIDKGTKYTIDTTSVNSAFQTLPDTAIRVSIRSDIKMMEYSISSMKLNTKLMSYEAKPDFNIRFEHMSPLGKGMPKMFSAMAMVSIPIAPWSSKMYKSQVKGMNNEIRSMEMKREGMISEAEGMARSMATEIRKIDQQLKNYRTRIIPALKKNYSTEMIAYEENKAQLPIVIDAWEALNMSQMEYLDKLEKYYLMIVSYEKELEK